MYKNLSQYIEMLEQHSELIRITEFVDPILEIAEITDRHCKSPDAGKALLFENTGTDFAVLTNMMGSERRICMALGIDSITDIEARLDTLLTAVKTPRRGLVDKLRLLPMLANVGKWLPKSTTARAACQECRLTSLADLPVLKTWPHDASKFVTLPLVHTIDPATGARNVGMYRMQIIDDLTTGMHWHRHKTGERHYEAYKKLGQRMPVTVCLGGDPAYTYAATAPLPDGIDEYLLAGFIRDRPVRLVKCLTNGIEIPADCDIVIEGYVDPCEDKIVEGPFGDHTGFYSLADHYPAFHVTCITHRRGAIYPATVVGVPPMEDAWIAAVTESIFTAPIKFAITPELTSMHMPDEGVAHNIAICTIDKTYPGQGFKIASAMWGAGQMMFNKYIVLLSTGDTVQERLPYFDPELDIVTTRGALDVLDHASTTIGFGGKMCFDLTQKLPEEGGRSASPFSVLSPVPSNCMVVEEWRTLIFFGSRSAVECVGLKFIVIFDAAAQGLPLSDLLWIASGNSDAVRDTKVESGALVIDARAKFELGRDFPNVVTMDVSTIARVDAKWSSLGLGELIESPSLRYHQLVMSDSAEVHKYWIADI